MSEVVPDLLASRAQLSGRDIAIEDAATGALTTYAELDAAAGRIAAWLMGRGRLRAR